MNGDSLLQIHASCISIDGAGVLIRGPSGSGKSDMALRLMSLGAELVADDRVGLSVGEDAVEARAPEALAGLMEVRGVGILEFPAVRKAPIRLIVDLVPSDKVDRLPLPETADVHGFPIPVIRLDPLTSSAAMKIQLALDLALGRIIRADD